MAHGFKGFMYHDQVRWITETHTRQSGNKEECPFPLLLYIVLVLQDGTAHIQGNFASHLTL